MVGALQPFGKHMVRGIPSSPKTDILLNGEEVAKKKRSDVVLKNWKPAEHWTVIIWGRMIPYFTRQTSNLEILCMFSFSPNKKHIRTLISCVFLGDLYHFSTATPGLRGVSFSWESLSHPPNRPLATDLSEWVHERPCAGVFFWRQIHILSPYQSTRCNPKILSVCYIYIYHSNVQVFLLFSSWLGRSLLCPAVCSACAIFHYWAIIEKTQRVQEYFWLWQQVVAYTKGLPMAYGGWSMCFFL